MKIVIIEDEYYTAEDLKQILIEADSSIEITDVVSSIEEAVTLLEKTTGIDLIFSDIELEDGLSFEIFSRLSINTPVIFCTAYNHYALEAFKTYSIDYILKPFSKEAVVQSLRKWKTMRNEFIGTLLNDRLTQFYQEKPRIPGSYLISSGEKIVPVNTDQIALFFISGNYVMLHTFDQKQYVTNDKLEALERQYSPLFFRVNRQFLINRNAIKDVNHHLSRKLKINLKFPYKEEILVGKLKMASFLSWLQQG